MEESIDAFSGGSGGWLSLSLFQPFRFLCPPAAAPAPASAPVPADAAAAAAAAAAFGEVDGFGAKWVLAAGAGPGGGLRDEDGCGVGTTV
jgi:hypothetical protein